MKLIFEFNLSFFISTFQKFIKIFLKKMFVINAIKSTKGEVRFSSRWVMYFYWCFSIIWAFYLCLLNNWFLSRLLNWCLLNFCGNWFFLWFLWPTKRKVTLSTWSMMYFDRSSSRFAKVHFKYILYIQNKIRRNK